jgi:hypothetical protein
VDPPRNVYWWYQYGGLELLPSVLFLGMMSTVSNKSRRSAPDDLDDEEAIGGPRTGMKRSESTNSNASAGRRMHESALLLKASSGSYGALIDPQG